MTNRKLEALIRDPAVSSVINKLVPDNSGRGKTPGAISPPNDAVLNKLSIITQNNLSDAKSIFQLLPEMELVKQILIAAIISPNNMVTNEINYTVADNSFEASMASSLLRVVSNFFENDYKIKMQLPIMLEDMLFYRGSYPIAILPESTIDAAINSNQRIGLETIREFCNADGHFKSLGLLGNTKEVANRTPSASLEGLLDYGHIDATAYDPYMGTKAEGNVFTVTDNPHVLKAPLLRKRMIHERVMTTFQMKTTGLEARKEFEPTNAEMKQMEAVLYKPRNYSYAPATALGVPNKSTNPTYGHPMIMKLPSESVIPVHTPGDPAAHVGYFVLLDVLGTPLSSANRSDYYSDMVNSLALKPDQVQSMIATNFPVQSGRFGIGQRTEMADLQQAYTSIVEQDLLMRLRNGIYGDAVEIARPQEVYRIMFARAMAKKQTQLLFIPAELMVYMAFDYNEYGIGKSLVEDTKILASLRIMMLFANTMAGIKNSVGRTGLEITLDPEDHEPANTVETLIHEYARTRNMAYPIGAANPLDVIDFLQRAAVDVHVTGNNKYPETRAEVVDKQANRTVVDTNLDDELKKRHIMSFGIAPETVDLGMNVEFATSIVSSNIMLAKRVKIYQDKTCGFLVDIIRKFILYSESLMNEMREIVNGNRKDIPDAIVERFEGSTKETISPDSVIVEFLKALEVSLPEPDSVKLENQLAAYAIKEQALDKALEAWISADLLSGTELGKAGEDVTKLLATVKAHFLRKYQRENNFLPELADLVTLDGDVPTLNLLQEQDKYLESMRKSVGEYMLKVQEGVAKNDKVINEGEAKIEAKFGEQPDSLDDTQGDLGADSQIGSDTTGDGTDGGGLDDDFGSGSLDDGSGTDETAETQDDAASTTDETSTTETSEETTDGADADTVADKTDTETTDTHSAKDFEDEDTSDKPDDAFKV